MTESTPLPMSVHKILDQMPGALFLVNSTNELLYVSPEWKELLGLNFKPFLESRVWGAAESTWGKFSIRYKPFECEGLTCRLGILEDISAARRFEEFFENAMEPLCISSMEGVFLRVNKSWERVLGYPRGKLENQGFLSMVHPEDRENTIQAMQVLSAGKPVSGFVNRYQHADGSWRHLEWNSRPLDGAIIASTRDVTDRLVIENALRESEKRYRQLFENMSSGFALHEIILDSTGKPCDYRFLEINPAFERMTGLLASSLIGKTVMEVMPQTERYWIDIYGSVALTGKSTLIENYAESLDKHYEVLAFSPHPGQFAVIFSDITDRKKNEAERERLVRELRGKRDEQESLIYALSHDLRSPLVNLQGFASELSNSVQEMLGTTDVAVMHDAGEEARECLSYIAASVTRLERLQSGALRYARIGRQELVPVAVDAAEVLDAVVRGMEHQWRSMGGQIHQGNLVKSFADRGALEQVFANIVENALKYSRPGTVPTLTVYSAEANGAVSYLFSDNGMGIPLEQRARVFEIFHRLDPQGIVGGEGLGLTLVRGLLHRMGGTIEVRDGDLGVGCCFVVTLPAAAR